MIAFREVLRKTARSLGIEPAMHLSTVESRWSQVVGPALAGATAPRSLRGGTLVVIAAHPLAAQEVRLRSEGIVAALQREVPQAGLRRIRVLVRGRA